MGGANDSVCGERNRCSKGAVPRVALHDPMPKNAPLSRVHIGCSGWNYRDWRGAFYPDDLPAKR
jgi:hypothetical protein